MHLGKYEIEKCVEPLTPHDLLLKCAMKNLSKFD